MHLNYPRHMIYVLQVSTICSGKLVRRAFFAKSARRFIDGNLHEKAGMNFKQTGVGTSVAGPAGFNFPVCSIRNAMIVSLL
jgi:hypothetical protein